MFNVEMIADSINPRGIRLRTMQLTYPRIVHAEFMTHRVFSRNASSSRAIPVEKVIAQVRGNPAMPVHWGANQRGMQANGEIIEKQRAKQLWLAAAESAATYAEQMMLLGLHKQVANRILEPYQWMHVICSGTEFDNFYELRDHDDAEPNIRLLAQMMKTAEDNSTPRALRPGEWHLPYMKLDDPQTETALKASAARCARVSYLTHDGKVPSLEKDLALFDQLAGGIPLHASPLEHQAQCMDDTTFYRNFRGWYPFRAAWEATLATSA